MLWLEAKLDEEQKRGQAADIDIGRIVRGVQP